MTARSLSGQQWVLALVDVAIDSQAFCLGRVVHELPQTPRARWGPSFWIQSTFHHRQVLQFLRQTLSVQHLFKQGKVHGGASQHGAQMTGSTGAKSDNPAMRHWVPSQVQSAHSVKRGQPRGHKRRIQLMSNPVQPLALYVPK